MIKLTRLGGEPFILNAELIRYVESRPDTFVSLTTGERIVVQETMDEVMRRTVDYQRSKHLLPAPAYDSRNIPQPEPASCLVPAGAAGRSPDLTHEGQ